MMMKPRLLRQLLNGLPDGPPVDSLPRKPKYIDPALRSLLPVLDSLSQAIGTAPDSVIFRPMPGEQGLYEPAASRLTVSPASENRRQTLTHEMGHVLQFVNQGLFFRWFDPNNTGRSVRRNDLERFADDFATAFDALSKNNSQRHNPKVSLLIDWLKTRPPFLPSAYTDKQ